LEAILRALCKVESEEMMGSILGWLSVVSLILVTLSRASSQECGVVSLWQEANNNNWTNPQNWADHLLPNDLSEVLLVEDNANTSLSQSVYISTAKIGEKSFLKISKGGRLNLFKKEVQCFDVNGCSGHGSCVGINVCDCDPGWTGTACERMEECPDGSVDECGYCNGTIVCECGNNVLGQSQEYVARLLLLETNALIQSQIDSVVENLQSLKQLIRRYDPYSQELATDVAYWLLGLQDFCDDSLDPFYYYNMEVLSEAEKIMPLTDPCDPTPTQQALEAYYSERGNRHGYKKRA